MPGFRRNSAYLYPDYLTLSKELRRGTVLFYDALFRHGSQMDEDNALQSLPQVEHWLPPVEGREKIQFDYTTKLIELPDLNAPGVWSNKYNDLLNRALTEKNSYNVLHERLTDIYNSSKRHRFFWSLSLALYNLQSSVPDLLLALKESDSKDKAQQAAGLEDVKKAVKGFKQAWKELEDVYSQTRFISYPADYVPDRYFHLASQKEDLTWMIQPEELYLG